MNRVVIWTRNVTKKPYTKNRNFISQYEQRHVFLISRSSAKHNEHNLSNLALRYTINTDTTPQTSHTHTHTQLPTHTPTPAHLHRDTQHSKFARCVMGRHAFNRQKCFKYSTRKCCWVPAKGKKTVYRWRREGASWGPRAACLTDLFNDTFMGSSHKLEFYVFWIECK